MKHFRNIYLIILTALVVGGCKKDDPAPINSESLVGSWKETISVTSNCSDPSENENYSCDTDCFRLIFTSNTLTIGVDGDQFTETYTYTIKGNTISYAGNNGVTISVTFEVTRTTLTLTRLLGGNCKNVSVFKKV